MKNIDKRKQLTRKINEANHSFYNYKSNDMTKIASMALAAELQFEDVIYNTNYYPYPYRDEVSRYMQNVYNHDFCLVLKMKGKIHPYTRRGVASKCRAEELHMKDPPRNLKPLQKFMREIEKAEVLFFIGLEFIGTPFSRGAEPVTDSTHFYEEYYTNQKSQKIQLTVIESLMLNIYSELAMITNLGKIGWQHCKVLLPFDESCKTELGDDVYNNIIKQGDNWKKWNDVSRQFKEAQRIVRTHSIANKQYLAEKYSDIYQ